MDVEVGDLLVARGWNWTPATLQSSAERDLRVQRAEGASDPVASVSVFAMEHDGITDVEELKSKLVAYMTTIHRSRWIGFTTSAKLSARGFEVRRNEPPDHHFDILTPDVEDLTQFEALSETFEERRKPA